MQANTKKQEIKEKAKPKVKTLRLIFLENPRKTYIHQLVVPALLEPDETIPMPACPCLPFCSSFCSGKHTLGKMSKIIKSLTLEEINSVQIKCTDQIVLRFSSNDRKIQQGQDHTPTLMKILVNNSALEVKIPERVAKGRYQDQGPWDLTPLLKDLISKEILLTLEWVVDPSVQYYYTVYIERPRDRNFRARVQPITPTVELKVPVQPKSKLVIINDAIKRIRKERLVPQEITRKRIVEDFQVTDVVSTGKIGGGGGVQEGYKSMSLLCPMTNQVIRVPGRGSACKHLNCFDLFTYLDKNLRLNIWMCPICSIPLPLDSFTVDQYFLKVLEHKNISLTDIIMLNNGSWIPKPQPKQRSSKSQNSKKLEVQVKSANRQTPSAGVGGKRKTASLTKDGSICSTTTNSTDPPPSKRLAAEPPVPAGTAQPASFEFKRPLPPDVKRPVPFSVKNSVSSDVNRLMPITVMRPAPSDVKLTAPSDVNPPASSNVKLTAPSNVAKRPVYAPVKDPTPQDDKSSVASIKKRPIYAPVKDPTPLDEKGSVASIKKRPIYAPVKDPTPRDEKRFVASILKRPVTRQGVRNPVSSSACLTAPAASEGPDSNSNTSSILATEQWNKMIVFPPLIFANLDPENPSATTPIQRTPTLVTVDVLDSTTTTLDQEEEMFFAYENFEKKFTDVGKTTKSFLNCNNPKQTFVSCKETSIIFDGCTGVNFLASTCSDSSVFFRKENHSEPDSELSSLIDRPATTECEVSKAEFIECEGGRVSCFDCADMAVTVENCPDFRLIMVQCCNVKIILSNSRFAVVEVSADCHCCEVKFKKSPGSTFNGEAIPSLE